MITKNLNQEVPVLGFYMACAKLIKRFLANVHHLDLFCQQLKLPLFTNIPLEETIKICCDSLYKNQELLSNINKNQFEKLLRDALCNNYFLFDGIVYQQVDGVAMGSLFGPKLS